MQVGGAVPGTFGQVSLVSHVGERSLDAHREPIPHPFSLVSAHMLQQRCAGVWQAAPLQFLPSLDHTACPTPTPFFFFFFLLSLPPALQSLLLICLSLPLFFLASIRIIFSHSGGFLVLILAWLRFSQTLVQVFWLLGVPDSPQYRQG